MQINIYDGNLSIKQFFQKCRQYRLLFLTLTVVGSVLGVYFSLSSPSYNTFTGKINYILTNDILVGENNYIYSYNEMGIGLNTIENIYNNMKPDISTDDLNTIDRFIVIGTSGIVNNIIKYTKNEQEYLQITFTDVNYEDLRDVMFNSHSKLQSSLIDHSTDILKLKLINLSNKIEKLNVNEMSFIDNAIDDHKKLFNLSYINEIEDVENLIKISDIIDDDINNISNILTMPEAISSFFSVIGASSLSSSNKYSYFEGKKILNEKLSILKKYKPDEKILNDSIYLDLLGDKYKITKQINGLEREIKKIEFDIMKINKMDLLPTTNFFIEINSPNKLSILIIYILSFGILGIILSFSIILLRESIKISK